jgi:hypothetical protein
VFTGDSCRSRSTNDGLLATSTGQNVGVGRVHASEVVRVLTKETTFTVHDGQAASVAIPRHSSTDVNRFRAKHQIRPSK